MPTYFDLQRIPPTPWKNGGGETREIACWPPGAGVGGFDWRISVARIARSGPFSAFPGIDRQIMLLEGGGVRLLSQSAGIDHVLDQPWQPFAFAGDVPLDCELLDTPCSDFNVMTLRNKWKAELLITQQVLTANVTSTGLCMVLKGTWHTEAGETLQPMQGLHWHSASELLELAPIEDEATIAWLKLTPTDSPIATAQ